MAHSLRCRPEAKVKHQSHAPPRLEPEGIPSPADSGARVRKDEFRGSERFELRSMLGEGGMGIVYEAFDRDHAKRVAIKALRALGPEALLLFKNEFRAVQHLRHPNLVALGELFEERGQWFFSMEFVSGVSFLDHVRPMVNSGHARLDVGRLRSALLQVARGLCALHAAERVHRDIKPSNVIVERGGRAIILDFGVVRDLGRRAAPTDDDFAGTIAYMAPEQALLEEVGPPSDWYAVGVMLFQALTGRLPFEGAGTDILSAKTTRSAPSPHELAPDAPPDLADLCEALLRLEPRERPAGSEVLARLGYQAPVEASPGGSSSGAVFVGRIAELGILAEAIAQVKEGRPASVVLSGESGVGKTAMVRQFTSALRVAHPDAVLFSGRCFERESVKYKAVDDVVDDISRFVANLPAATVAELVPSQGRLLSTIFPVLANVSAFREAPEATQEPLVPREMRNRVFAALRELLCRIAARWPVVVSVDDLQWADPDSRALLDAVLRPPNAPPLLFLATVRTGTEHGRTDSPFELPGDVRYIHVEKLPPADAEQLAARLTGREGEADAEARAIAREAGGHPLFIDELIRRRGRNEQGARAVRLDDALWSRVGELGPVERKVIELLAVAGLPIPYDVAAAAGSLSLGELFDAVATLRATKLARTDGARRADAVDTYHDRVRDSVLAHLEPAERKMWHGRLALAFEAKQAEKSEILSMHWQGAGEPARAALYAERAADEAARSLAFERASRLYRSALAQSGESGAARKSLELRLADALTNAGRSFDAAEVRMELARAREDVQAIDQRRIAAEQYLTSGHFTEGIATLRAVIAQVDLHFPRSPLTAILLMVFYRLMLRFRGLSITESPESAEPDRRRLLRTDCTWSAASGLLMTDNVMGAYFQTRALALSLRLGEPALACRAFCMEALAAGAPDRARSEDLLARARPLAEKVASPFVRALVAAADGGTAYFWGEWERAAPLLIEAEDRFREQCVGVTFELNSLRMMLFRVLAYIGDLKALERRAGPVLEEAEGRQDRYAIINTRAVALCTLHMAADAPDLAERELTLIQDQLPTGKFLVQHYLYAFARGQLDLYVGRPAEAYADAALVWKALKRAFLLRVPLIRIMTRDLRARSAIGAARIDAARKESLLSAAESDARELEREPFSWAHALAHLLHGQIALARGQRDEARRVLTLAVAALGTARMPLHAAAARMALGGLGSHGDQGLAAEAEVAIRACSFVRPERAVAMVAPGA